MEYGTAEFAKLLGVTPCEVRMIVSRSGFPRPVSSPGVRRRFRAEEVLAVRDELNRGSSITTAVQIAQRALPQEAAG